MSMYPSLEDMKVDQMLQVNLDLDILSWSFLLACGRGLNYLVLFCFAQNNS